MARAKRWTIPFKSLNGTDCRIDIYDEGYTDTAVELSPNNANAPGYAAAEPIFYEEDNSDNLLNVIRYKTCFNGEIINRRARRFNQYCFND